MSLFYDFIFLIFAIVSVPFLALRGKIHRGFSVRFGKIPQDFIKRLKFRESVWVHAVSIGEVLTVVDLIKRLKEAYPDKNIICSTVTPAGYETAQENLKDVAQVIYAPFDLSTVVHDFIRIINPLVYIVSETEIWPNMFLALSQKKVPLFLVNGRISDKSYAKYHQIKFFIKPVLRYVRYFCVQSLLDKNRLESLGANEESIIVTGNMKFDLKEAEVKLKRETLGYAAGDRIFLAASTHPGEDQICVDSYLKLRLKSSFLCLMIVPRHIEKTDGIVETVKRAKLNPVLFSQMKQKLLQADDVVIIDQIGFLRSCYAISDVVFIGKTFKVGGGQNMIEPALFKKPIVVGPLTENFKDVMRQFLDRSAIVQVSDEAELLLALEKILTDSSYAKGLGLMAYQVLEDNQGATQRVFKIIQENVR